MAGKSSETYSSKNLFLVPAMLVSHNIIHKYYSLYRLSQIWLLAGMENVLKYITGLSLTWHLHILSNFKNYHCNWVIFTFTFLTHQALEIWITKHYNVPSHTEIVKLYTKLGCVAAIHWALRRELLSRKGKSYAATPPSSSSSKDLSTWDKL